MSSFEQKYCLGTNDGQYQMFWDLSALIKDLSGANVPIKNYDVGALSKANDFYGNSEYAMKTDVEKPCIIAVLNEKTEKLIDGNHRLYKAKQLKLERIPCYVLPEEYHKKFIIDYDDSIYKKVIADFIK